MTQRMIKITSPFFIPEHQILSVSDFTRVFGNNRPLALEIGCGIGDFVVQLAQQNSEVNFLAIDIYNKGCYKTCKKVEAAGLENVRVMRVEARHLLTNHIARESLAAIYINCPDPWPKKRHRRRRLADREFLHRAFCCLRFEGDFYFNTDFADYAEEVAQILSPSPGYCNCLAASFLPTYPLSKYMRRFLDQGHPIYFVHYRKGKCSDDDLLSEVRLESRVLWSKAENE